MSMENVKELLEKVKSDENLQKEMMAVLAKKDPVAAEDFMRQHGVSEDEIKVLRDQQQSLKTKGDLNEEMLELVVGGGCWSRIGDCCVLVHCADDGSGCSFVHGGL
jgi:hypothetical protein